jgi:hypothetical protein
MAEDIQPSTLDAETTPRTLAGGTSKLRSTLRILRIVFSAGCGILCLLLIYLSIRSHVYAIRMGIGYAFKGVLSISVPSGSTSFFASVLRWLAPIEIPLYIFALLAATIAALPWVTWYKGFSLRAFLITTTLVAALLGAIVYAVR